MNDDLLIQRLLDGTLTPSEHVEVNQRLRDEAGLRGHLRDIADQAVAMGDLARQEKTEIPVLSTNTVSKNARFTPWMALAASLAVLATSVWLFLGSRESPVLTLVDASGSVAWSHGGEWRMDVGIGQKMPAGTIETVGESATALLQFRDGTLISLTGESELSFSGEDQKLLVLRKGSISAEVKPQPKGRPMLVRTSSAEAQVVGTVFNLAARTDDTLLKVDEGLVKLKRLADGSTIDVPANSSAVASLDSGLKLDSSTTPEPLTNWSFDFMTAVPPRNWRGVSDGKNMMASPYVASRKDSGEIITHFGIAVRPADFTPPFSLIATEGSIIRYRLRQDQNKPIQVMLLTSKISGGYGGNFEVKIHEADLHPDHDGWCEIAIPLSDFEPLSRQHTSPTGCIINSVLLSSYKQDTHLTISRFSLTSPQ